MGQALALQYSHAALFVKLAPRILIVSVGGSGVKESATEVLGKRLGNPSRSLGPAAAAKLRKRERPVRRTGNFDGDWDLEGERHHD